MNNPLTGDFFRPDPLITLAHKIAGSTNLFQGLILVPIGHTEALADRRKLIADRLLYPSYLQRILNFMANSG